MGLKEEILENIKTIVNSNFNTKEVDFVPTINDSKLTFGNTGLKFTAAVLYIDIKDSTLILNDHRKASIAKIHMAYFHGIIKIAALLGGEIRSFNGDSMLVFFPGTTKDCINNATTAAMQMVHIITETNNLLDKKYSPIKFGIGIDYGNILCTKIGVSGDSNKKDLIWIGNAVNRSTVLSDTVKQTTRNIGISQIIYDNLYDIRKYITEEGWFGPRQRDFWDYSYMDYNNESKRYFYTNAWVPTI